MKQLFITIIAFILMFTLFGKLNAQNRWKISPSGGITWTINEKSSHYDHIEMSGLKVSTIMRYGVDELGRFSLDRGMVWPLLRTIPNNTHASLMRRFNWNVLDMVMINGRSFGKENVKSISLKGLMTVVSESDFSNDTKLELTRVLFPSVSNPAFCERYIIRNTGKKDFAIEVPAVKSIIKTDPQKGVDGAYSLVSVLIGQPSTILKPGEELSFGAYFIGQKLLDKEIFIDVLEEEMQRESLINEYWSSLVLETPDSVLNTMFAFAKIRGTESIYDTKGGLLHGPGGESYYAAIWANDQAEYINPFFPFLGNKIGNKSAMNTYKHFARFINDEYKPLPSSIVAEGLDVWGGAGDRGDAAMIAYGAARYALARGSKQEAEELWPLITWCLEYCKRNLNDQGVVHSDSDELEGRFPAGTANLCTSSLYYDALLSASFLGKDLGKSSKQLALYTKQAKALRIAIDSYFGGFIEGFESYKYYKENDVLRSWICIPLTVGIYDRKEETIKALFSERLWTNEGLLTQAGSETFWDRSTLYALRGVYACGETEKATNYLKYYSGNRLLGEHVPYAIEAWPEGNQRHLSAESGLYCRIITEGLFGIRPTGLRTFTLTPRLPKDWDSMALRKIKAFNHSFDIEIHRQADKIQITVKLENKIYVQKQLSENQTIQIKF